MPTNDYSKNIVYLSKEQYQELITNETLTVNGQTITYNDNDIYVTPQAEPITDVKINGTSIGSNGVANIPYATNNNLGLIQGAESKGITITNGSPFIRTAPDAVIKEGDYGYLPITPINQHKSIFYGLSKLAGVDLANETVTLGTYPDSSKAAIQNMLGITDLLSTEESSTATVAHALNSTFMMNGKLHRATAAIAVGDAVEVGTNCEMVRADEVFVKKTDIATANTAGVVKVEGYWGISLLNGILRINEATTAQIKQAISATNPIVPGNQHISVFYGLSRVAGVDLANETVTLGTYPETSKTAIRSLIGAAAASSTITDVQVNGSSVVSNNVANIPLASANTDGVAKIGAWGLYMRTEAGVTRAAVDIATSPAIRDGNSGWNPIAPNKQHEAVFYGLAKAAGDSTQPVSTNAVGTYTDEASAAIRNMLGTISNTNYATSDTGGVVKINGGGLVMISSGSQLVVVKATDAEIKAGTHNYDPIVPSQQHKSVFYGLAKAAGDTTQSASSNAVGTYTTEAKAAIHTMLGIDSASIAAQVDIPLVETVSGTTPSITGQPNVRYVCSEVSTITLTPPASGSMDVIFESGSTAAVLTVPNTVKWPAWFDASSLETDTTYEILITDGVYGSVMSWAN